MYPQGLDWVQTPYSTNVAAMAYQPDFYRSFVRFKDSRVYQYDGINPGVWRGFLAAGSKGRFVWNVLRARGSDSVYSYRRVA